MEVIFYSTNCPKCKIIKTKLEEKGIDFIEVNNISEIKNQGISEVPQLKVGGTLLKYYDANTWINSI